MLVETPPDTIMCCVFSLRVRIMIEPGRESVKAISPPPCVLLFCWFGRRVPSLLNCLRGKLRECTTLSIALPMPLNLDRSGDDRLFSSKFLTRLRLSGDMSRDSIVCNELSFGYILKTNAFGLSDLTSIMRPDASFLNFRIFCNAFSSLLSFKSFSICRFSVK